MSLAGFDGDDAIRSFTRVELPADAVVHCEPDPCSGQIVLTFGATADPRLTLVMPRDVAHVVWVALMGANPSRN